MGLFKRKKDNIRIIEWHLRSEFTLTNDQNEDIDFKIFFEAIIENRFFCLAYEKSEKRKSYYTFELSFDYDGNLTNAQVITDDNFSSYLFEKYQYKRFDIFKDKSEANKFRKITLPFEDKKRDFYVYRDVELGADQYIIVCPVKFNKLELEDEFAQCNELCYVYTKHGSSYVFEDDEDVQDAIKEEGLGDF